MACCTLARTPPGTTYSGWLVVDANLEASGAQLQVHKLDGTLGLDGSNGCVHVLGHDITTVEHAIGHVLPCTRVTFHYLVGWLEASVHRSIGHQGKVRSPLHSNQQLF